MELFMSDILFLSTKSLVPFNLKSNSSRSNIRFTRYRYDDLKDKIEAQLFYKGSNEKKNRPIYNRILSRYFVQTKMKMRFRNSEKVLKSFEG